MTLPRRPRCREDLIFRQVDEDFVVYDPVTDRTALLNLSAAVVLDLCDGSRTVDEMAAEVAAIFVDEERDFLPDVEAAVRQLLTQGFLDLPREALR